MSHGEKTEVYRGHLEECLSHLSSKLSSQFPKYTRGADAVRKPIADFCGVKTKMVSHWLLKGKLPKGETLIKLMFFLDSQGYKIIELEHISRSRRNFAELIAFGVLSSNEASLKLGYKNIPSLYYFISGRGGAKKAKEERMWEIWKEKREVLEQKKADASARFSLSVNLENIPAKKMVPEGMPKASSKAKKIMPAGLFKPGYDPAIKIIDGLLELIAEENLFSEISLSDEKRLRQAASNIVLRLSICLNKLCLALTATTEKKGGRDD